MVGPNGKEVSALITYDSFASQSSIASSLVSSMNLIKKNLGKVKIQTYAGIIADDGHTASVRIKELNNKLFEFLINHNPQTLGVCQAKIPLAWKKKYRELKWNHKTKGGLNNVVIGKDLSSLFPKAVGYKNNMVLSESRITGGPIISGRMDSST